MKKYLLVCLVAILANNVKAQTNYSADVANKIKQFEQNLGAFETANFPGWSLLERMKFYKIPGLSIAVVHNYKIEWARGYGWADSAEQRPVTVQTLFEPGSISKSFNAVAVLKLAQNKKLDLDADINNYLTSWKFPYDSLSKNKKITPVNLLSHTAGLNVHGFYGYTKGDTLPTIVEILDGKKPANSEAVRSMFEPGLRFEYSGGGTMISELMVMDVAKQPYDKYLYKNVLQPLGMAGSFYTQPPPANKIALLATGYDAEGKAVKGKYPILMEQAAGGLWTTPTDLCKFIIETQLSYQGKSNKILSKEMTVKMLTPYIDSRSALGVFVNENWGAKYFGHDAGNIGFSGEYYGSFEGGNGIAVIINSENSGILSEVTNSIASVYGWQGFEKQPIKKVVPVADGILQKYTGTYVPDNADTTNSIRVTVSKKDGSYYYIFNDDLYKMYFTSEKDFFNMERPTQKTFYTDEKGTVKGFISRYAGRESKFKKID